MTDNNIFYGNEKAMFIANSFRNNDGDPSPDIIAAYRIITNVCENEFEERIQKAYILVKYMEPELIDVITILLSVPYRKYSISRGTFKSEFRDDRTDNFYSVVKKAAYNSLSDSLWQEKAIAAYSKHNWDEYECIDYSIMQGVSDKMCNKLCNIMSKSGIPDSMCIYQAYDLAKRAHMWVLRATGEPYITHPLKVANILTEVKVESSVIAAALLHDVVEDTEYTIDYIKEEFGDRIAGYVDTVTSVEREVEKSNSPDLYQLDHEEIDQKTFDKIIAMIESKPQNVFALYIKAADRIHNLRTIDTISSIKRNKKVNETEYKYLPLFRKYHLNYFVDILEDLVWRVNNKSLYDSISAKYNEMLSNNSTDIDTTEELISKEFMNNFRKSCQRSNVSGYEVEINKSTYSPYTIYKMIKSKDNSSFDNVIDSVKKSCLTICDFDIILDPLDEECDIDLLPSLFVEFFNKRIADNGMTIVDIEKDSFNRVIFFVEDNHRNIYRYRFMMRSDYNVYCVGHNNNLVEYEDISIFENSTSIGSITVFLRNGKPVTLPEGSTVLDLAFKIHEKVGLSAISATINGNEAEVYTILHDMNKVEVIADTEEENGVTTRFVPRARIDWLACVVTKTAKEKILKYLERKYHEEDKPRFESKSKVDQTRFDTIYKLIYDEWTENGVFDILAKEEA